MRRIALILATVLTLAIARPSFATPITGTIAIAGADTYTSTGIHFTGPAMTLIATGNFLPLLGQSTTINNFNFASASGTTLFASVSPLITMDVLSLMVVTNSANFLNISGTADFSEPGFDTTLFDFTLTATRPDGVSSFTLTAAPLAPIPEPTPLILMAIGLCSLAGLLHRKGIKQRI